MNNCGHDYTIKDITVIVNDLRGWENMESMPYEYVLKNWHSIRNNYAGVRNPYVPRRIIGRNYIFTQKQAEKIADKIWDMQYDGDSSSYSYAYWNRAA